MKKKLHISFFLFLSAQFSFSQAPGYMGKHLVIGYSLNFIPAFVGPTSTTTNHKAGSSDLELVGINNTHILNLDYIHHRRKAICLTIQYARTGVDYVDGNYARYDGNINKPAVMNSIGIGVGIKLFKRANFAPYGPYVKWEGMMLLNTVDYNNTDWSTADPNNYNIRIKSKQGSGEATYQVFGIGFSWGTQRVFKDKFVFDRGVKILAIPAAVYGLDYTSGPVESQFESAGIQRLFRHQFINFHLGIGFLAF